MNVSVTCLRAVASMRRSAWTTPAPAAAASRSLSSSSLWPLDLDLSSFPQIQCSIGYGSGVFRQLGYSMAKRPMVDLVFIVEDAAVAPWHAANLVAHREHYSGLMRMLGPAAIAHVQRWGPGLYYNPSVHLQGKDGSTLEAKYGVMTIEDFLRDLTSWDSMYIAGRLHKPCLIDFWSCDQEVQKAISAAVALNRKAALSAALLECSWNASSQEQVPLFSVLNALVQLSFGGDVRVGIAENPNKVSNIVRGQKVELCEVYGPIANELGADFCAAPDGTPLDARTVTYDCGVEGRRSLFGQLPDEFRQCAEAAAASTGRGKAPWDDPEIVRGVLSSIVRRSSIIQSGKGVLTAGPMRSVRYLLQKVRKRLS